MEDKETFIASKACGLIEGLFPLDVTESTALIPRQYPYCLSDLALWSTTEHRVKNTNICINHTHISL